MPTEKKPLQGEQPVQQPVQQPVEKAGMGEGQITVDAAQLKKLTDRIEEQDKKIQFLNEIADKSRVDWWRKGHPDSKALAQVEVRHFPIESVEGTVWVPVTGWRMTKNESYKNASGVWVENQQVELLLADGTRREMVYIDSERLPKRKLAEVTKSTTSDFADGSSETILHVRVVETGQELEISSRFIN